MANPFITRSDSMEPQVVPQMEFPAALTYLREGNLLSRMGWNGKDMFIYMVKGGRYPATREPLLSIIGQGTEFEYRPHIDMKYADGSFGVWSPSNSDILARDWYVVDREAL